MSTKKPYIHSDGVVHSERRCKHKLSSAWTEGLTQQEIINRLAEAMTTTFEKAFDRSFAATIDVVDGKIRIRAEQQDSGNDPMTVADVAAKLQLDRASVRLMTKQRAQKSMRHPIPFFKLGGKLRFIRALIMEWLAAQAAEKPVFSPAKKRKR